MKRRDIDLRVTDHAVLRYLERCHGLDIEAVRRHLAGLAVNAAELGAVAVRVEAVRLFLADTQLASGRHAVAVVTVGPRDMVNGLGRSRARERDDG